ncbi:hypothetical protein, conserved [Plasmodium gonderi]|uniref:Dolichyl-diphosphooligosaccharide--protein glycosyltransferase subunit 2 n=1 Tax=Plasmodium gonderi TaxID=77519 RepID=A0A1Y1JFM5_PLAGO|nr:hypothetical protein, conserved [Plasmodium gonderi]GAW81296.1 hypothetical protein, conserved [Plasmodium gonderi]
MQILFLFYFIFFLLDKTIEKGINNNNVTVHKDDEDFLLLNKAKITAVTYSNAKKIEKSILHKVLENEGKEKKRQNSYVLLDERVDAYEMLNIRCIFKIRENFDKTKLIILLVKQLEEKYNHKKDMHYGCNDNVEDLKKDETFVFKNEFEGNLVISKVSLLFVNLIAFNGYYNFDILITDGANSVKISFFKMYLHFHNHIPIVKFPLREKENRIIRNIMKRHLCRRDKMFNYKYVIYKSRDYYPLPVFQENNIIYRNSNEGDGINPIIPIIYVTLLLVFFLIYVYFIFIHLKINMKNINISYYNYAFLFSFTLLMFLFILYDLFFNILHMLYIFPLVFFPFLVFFYKSLNILRAFRKCPSHAGKSSTE